MDHGGGDLITQTRATFGCVAAQVKVHERRFWLLPLRAAYAQMWCYISETCLYLKCVIWTYMYSLFPEIMKFKTHKYCCSIFDNS